MVELLAVGLTGCKFGYESAQDKNTDGGPSEGGELLIAMDPARFGGTGDSTAALEHAEGLFKEILQEEGTRLPSDRRYIARQQTPTEGITIPESLHKTIMEYCEG
jgi:LDH2 family malate/lactate/ureidoglycolate dehydrogenase